MQNKITNFLKSNLYTIYWIFNPSRTISITLEGVINYFKAYYRQSKDFYDLPIHIQEQIIWRNKISRCSNYEYCQYCGCPSQELFYGDLGCKDPNPCFPKLMSNDEWLLYIKDNNIKL